MKRIHIRCPKCRVRLRGATVEAIGTISVCPRCKAEIPVTPESTAGMMRFLAIEAFPKSSLCLAWLLLSFAIVLLGIFDVILLDDFPLLFGANAILGNIPFLALFWTIPSERKRLRAVRLAATGGQSHIAAGTSAMPTAEAPTTASKVIAWAYLVIGVMGLFAPVLLIVLVLNSSVIPEGKVFDRTGQGLAALALTNVALVLIAMQRLSTWHIWMFIPRWLFLIASAQYLLWTGFHAYYGYFVFGYDTALELAIWSGVSFVFFAHVSFNSSKRHNAWTAPLGLAPILFPFAALYSGAISGAITVVTFKALVM